MPLQPGSIAIKCMAVPPQLEMEKAFVRLKSEKTFVPKQWALIPHASVDAVCRSLLEPAENLCSHRQNTCASQPQPSTCILKEKKS
jgi:hypothetical protein